MNTITQLQNIFNEIQTCDSKRFTENMKTTLELIGIDKSFLHIIDTILVYQRNSAPPRVVHFFRRLIEELDESKKETIHQILLYLVDKLSCKVVKVRKNALKLINMILSVQGGCNNNDILAKIAEKLFDKEQSVRKEALKICTAFQNEHLCGSLKIHSVIKDMVRYDPSHEIRKIGFLGLQLNESTYNCILERCIDTSVSIRKAFWMQYFPNIDLSCLTHVQRIYLMKKGVNEREFNAKDIFLEKIREYGLERFIDDFYCEEEEYEVCIEDYLKRCNDEYELVKYTPSYLQFLCCYYKITEEKCGRDALKLPPLEEFLQIFYLKCVEFQKAGINDTNELKVLKHFLKILVFYDLFTDESKKYVISIVNHIVLTCNFIQVVEDCVILLTKTHEDNLEKITGNLIKKTRGKPICFALCEAVMKHIPLSQIHDAILCEIAILDIEQSTDIFFWYFVKNPNPNIESQYLSLLPNKKVIQGCADLVINGILDVVKIEDCLRTQLARFNHHCVIPVCKLLLSKKLTAREYVKYLLLVYYSTDIESIQQYLSVFFFEYFKNTPSSIISVFCDVLCLITANHRVFIDQSIFWISNTSSVLEYQNHFLSVSTFIYNNYDDIPNRKHLFAALSAIPIDQTWNPMTTKAIITVLGMIIRKRPRENVNILMNQVMEIDDGVPLPASEFEKLKMMLKIEQ